ncbi:MAG: hypothetical protein LBB75_08190 [Oscillospiraceae bacterium]|jgi:hypothetical protein|nr:hypothetical protein [Oscillospiraceae bacterium]
MLYPENQKPSLSPETFQNPGPEYRGTPFWAWNCQLDQETLGRQIDCMKEMGFGGFHMHVRVGMTTEYLSDEFMGYVKGCADKAKREGMLAWLYDEDKWPSGFAGGLVTKDPKYRGKSLRFTREELPEGRLLARYAVALDSGGCLRGCKRLAQGEGLPQGAQARYAYLVADADADWYNGQSYVDTLSPQAIEEFVNVTHERYARALGRQFGKSVPAIFTDEPQTSVRRGTLESPEDTRAASLPWTGDLAQTYRDAYGEDILDCVPELFFELPEGRVSRARYRYHDHASERFAAAFADTVGKWCERHNLMLTGHMMEEPTLRSQIAALGECMRSYRSFQLPGIDMLAEARELITAKQCQSAVHQYARPGMLSELYGVSNWNYTFRHHKLQGDWQAALGVSVRVPHLYWVSMRGEAKRDYPASIGHQSPWYRQYKFIEDHFARVAAAMTRGKPLVRIGVIHPVESAWLRWGPESQTRPARDEMDARFAQLTEWLLYSQLDFDFICESLLPGQYNPRGEGFRVGAMEYDAVVAPWLETIRSTTLNALNAFEAKGGKVLWLGRIPAHVDGEFAGGWHANPAVTAWSKTKILEELEPCRLHSVTQGGVPATNILSQWREDGNCRWLFLCHAEDSDRYYTNEPRKLQIHVKGHWRAQKYDTLTGDIAGLPARYPDGETVADWAAWPQDSLLLRLEPGTQPSAPAKEAEWRQAGELPPVNPVTLSEPNALVLDLPEWSLDGGAWRAREEALRVGDGCKRALGLQNEIRRGRQPWTLKDDKAAKPTHTLRLRHAIQSKVSVGQVRLAIEDLPALKLTWNGADIPPVAEGHYVDEAIQTVTLGALKEGENLLEIELPFGKVTTVENAFLLGDFGVEVTGREAVVTGPVRALAFGDWTRQGLPFYGGNVVYHADVPLEGGGGQYALEATHFAQPVLGVSMDGADRGLIAISPWRAPLGRPAAGPHRVDLTAYGNRMNTFGALHNCDYADTWHGPGAWRGEGCGWTYEYRLRESGVLMTPRLLAEAS